jgi:DNA-directed RNA polymerase subunit RPC12/RpoP
VQPDQIRLGDWQRILIGQAPWSFLCEVLLRSVIVYVLLPEDDEELRRTAVTVPGQFACYSCGTITESRETPLTACPRCGSQRWTPAVRERTAERRPRGARQEAR